MEIRVLCPCGTKFKFDVEPVRARMPTPVSCPACGADATGQANTVIEQNRQVGGPALESPSTAPPPVSAPLPSGGLRINRAAVAADVLAGEKTVPPSPPPPISSRPSAAKKRQKHPIVQVLSTILAVAIVGLGVWRFGTKWYRRISMVAQVASAVGHANTDTDKSESSGPVNLWYEKCAVLFIHHTNHLEIAKACQDYWKTKLHKNLLLTNESREYMEPGEYELIPAHNGYVRIVGAFEWPIPAQEGLAQHLSQTFGSYAFEWRSESFADTYHFGVYDQGIRKFHAQMDIKKGGDDLQEIVSTEGDEFAKANGYKPGADGFKNFDGSDADKITLHLGMNLGDEKENADVKTMLLKETAGK